MALHGVLEGVVGTSWRLCWAMLGARWVQEGFESEFFVQLGVLMGILAPRWQDKASQDESERVVHGGTWVPEGREVEGLARPAAEAWSSKGGDLKIPELDSEV